MTDLPFPNRAHIVQLGRNPEQVDLYAIGSDGNVCTAWWHDTWRLWGSFGPGDLPPGASLSALSRNDNHMEVWAVRLLIGPWGVTPYRPRNASNGTAPALSPESCLSRPSATRPQ